MSRVLGFGQHVPGHKPNGAANPALCAAALTVWTLKGFRATRAGDGITVTEFRDGTVKWKYRLGGRPFVMRWARPEA
jgi:hypothetical protein